MSSSPAPVTQATAPFVPTTTPAIDRANRLMGLRSHPGFSDLIRLSQDLVQQSADILIEYAGWDPQQIMVLKARAQAAKEHHLKLISIINDAIEIGIAEQRALQNTLPEKTAAEAVEQGDYVRQQVLTRFREMDDMRVAGSYTPEEINS